MTSEKYRVNQVVDTNLELNGVVDVTNKDQKSENEKKSSFLGKFFKKKEEPKKNMVSFLEMFQCATKLDYVFMAIGTLGALANGATLPLLILVFTVIIDSFSSFGRDSICSVSNITLNSTSSPNGQATVDSLLDKMKMQSIYLVLLGIASMILNYFQVTYWIIPAERQARQIRKKLFSSILKQDIGWFDTYKSGELTNRLTDDVNKIKEGISEKLGNAIQYMATFLASLIISFIRGWKLTLVILSVSPLLFISSALFTQLTAILTTNELKSYAMAGAIAEECITAIRTVFAFNGGKKEHQRYEKKLDLAKNYGIKKGFINGAMMGFLWIVINCAYALGFWYGWTLTEKKDPVTGEYEYSVGKILLVFFNILTGVFSLGNAGPLFGILANARAAGYEVFNIMNRKPPIDSSSEEGLKPNDLVGNIEFERVSFNYPSRPDIKILKNVSYKIRPGQTVALVGSSGCGKSTCLQLIQRFYDPLDGAIKIDNRNLTDYNVKWLRTLIGVVNQEPILFGTTIKENIKFGKDSATDEEIIQAARNANAHDFIMTLPDKYETFVGDRGGQLSGGQKQRIAIARALVRNPKILLLDEATSALDNESESIVQAALDRASHGRTTIIVAHRLSTILNADVIFAFDKGELIEFGTHNELMQKRGIYYNLVITQQNGSDVVDKKKKNLNKENFEEIDLKSDNKIALDSMKNAEKEQIKKEEEKKEKKSKSKSKEEKKKDKEKEPSMKRVFALNKPEWFYILIGCLASLIAGAVQPCFSIILSKAVGLFSLCDYEERKYRITIFCILFIIIGVITFLSYVIQNGMFAISGENLTKRIRSEGFKKMLSQEIGWFDKPENNVGVLCTKLSVEASSVKGATGIRLGFFLMNLGNLGVGIILSFVFGWALTLCILAFVPFMIIGGAIQTKMLAGFSSKDKETLEEAGKITTEAISSIRTVANLNKEKYFVDKYMAKIKIPYKDAMKSAHINGFLVGFSTSIIFYAIAAAYTLGAYLVQNRLFGMDLEKIMLVYGCVMFGAQSAGQASGMLPDYAKAKAAIVSIFELFDRVPLINNWESNDGQKLNDYRKNISLDAIEFAYPARPDAKILKGINLTIKEGQRVAFVGSSGCGKSTITQLIERFYDADAGQVKLDGNNLKELNLHWLRSQVGIVSQEPILFDMSIAENIAYGDNSREVKMEEIIEATKQANIYDFISKLPQGFDTNVGSKGTQLSGGQKQRIAIARALVRNPKILLLDEATSALDTESEKIVQEALDRAQQGRTCIIIAHRLSTIRNCDLIFVLQNGVVTEVGNHDELIRLNGFYAKLNGQHVKDDHNEDEHF